MNNSVKIYIEYEGISYCFKNEENWDRNMFHDKCLYMIKNKNIQNIDNISTIWVYKKYYGVSYPTAIEKLLVL